MLRALRSMLFYASFTLWTLIWALLLLPFPLLPQSWRYWGCGTWARVASYLFSWSIGVRYRVQGLENIPAGPCVILSNHQSSLETLLLWRYFPRLSFVLKAELLRFPIIGWYLPLGQPIAINRQAGRQALKQVLEEGEKRLRAGIPVLIFPEGTRQGCGELGAFHQTGVALAQRAGVPITPLALNSGCFWSRHDWRMRSGELHLHFGPADNGEGRSNQVTDRLREWIAAEIRQMPAHDD
ncbi:1-acyl-sn-glycerol-3-phosphate acyltransferase [Acidithiobacillus sp. CV18-2]|uniref:1-acyl-sn-glycerol-3-phosphate acyltransferase n=1 Tax=Igneacidithiobacillus copahuensis TaxID=2724909 RepID=A0AAE2YQ12_9PROT|nr:lysophospholipid acyltransferase family protein [Igneacidithiobacillus copahuensis]MBU2754719.1 1-acyl-sn-glycerol-3-phosphate acyltransferase [Acidithiobacillus sp. CV18-3]MBU2756857.1 1-acyl-sn-glycerol-3-phosphate acyltransferase [Acidithiobacillus sp. BN09-2]MBU2778467.1 1-acyl-sn-glycerol-3-phosphate acyltransferase [Acidithiobacillus sp. CV18-2]MBU2795273.1 1-acyl-sn-glycerol-3-phosphate acyltransferase [Acidithiobacillus sp. VAN18-2]MBU2798118.1 1-acyl-sn-glycerol-3-phosphate acyltra